MRVESGRSCRSSLLALGAALHPCKVPPSVHTYTIRANVCWARLLTTLIELVKTQQQQQQQQRLSSPHLSLPSVLSLYSTRTATATAAITATITIIVVVAVRGAP